MALELVGLELELGMRVCQFQDLGLEEGRVFIDYIIFLIFGIVEPNDGSFLQRGGVLDLSPGTPATHHGLHFFARDHN